MNFHFRTAFRGFHRQDVVQYLEYVNNRHNTQINQLMAELETLRQKEACQPEPDRTLEDRCRALEQRCSELEQALQEALKARSQAEQERIEAIARASGAQLDASQELEAYRRAERAERVAKERAELIYSQTTGVLTEASRRVNSAAAQLAGVSDQVSAQLDRLRSALTDSRQALQDASETMNRLHPDP